MTEGQKSDWNQVEQEDKKKKGANEPRKVLKSQSVKPWLETHLSTLSTNKIHSQSANCARKVQVFNKTFSFKGCDLC